MREISATVTVGTGSERHNHDADYRQTLPHVVGDVDDVIELIPYQDYEKQINEMMRPYIEEYNARQAERYQAAWDRYNRGEIKSKPKKKDFQPMSFDYYKEHKDDKARNPKTGKVENVPMFRSVILGVGDQNDRQNITREEAFRIFGNTLKRIQTDFPLFRVLGATVHADERGFWHCHLDFKVLYEKENGAGLHVGTGFDNAMKKMNYTPEQSIINGRDKVPLYFNAMRNRIYYALESAMNAEKIRLQYGVSERKAPTKDAGKNQRLEVWQETQDAVRELQHNKNVALEILERDQVTPDDLKEAFQTLTNIQDKIEEIDSSPKSRMDKNKRIVEFKILDQLRSFFERLVERIAVIYKERNEYKEKYEAEKERAKGHVLVDAFEYAKTEKQIETLERQNRNLRDALGETGVSDRVIEEIANRGKNLPADGSINH